MASKTASHARNVCRTSDTVSYVEGCCALPLQVETKRLVVKDLLPVGQDLVAPGQTRPGQSTGQIPGQWADDGQKRHGCVGE